MIKSITKGKNIKIISDNAQVYAIYKKISGTNTDIVVLVLIIINI